MTEVMTAVLSAEQVVSVTGVTLIGDVVKISQHWACSKELKAALTLFPTADKNTLRLAFSQAEFLAFRNHFCANICLLRESLSGAPQT